MFFSILSSDVAGPAISYGLSQGATMIDNLSADGIDVQYLFRAEDTATGTALIMVDKEGHNLISVAPGANYKLLPEHVDQFSDLMQKADMIVLQCELSDAALDYILDRAAEWQGPVMLNLAKGGTVGHHGRPFPGRERIQSRKGFCGDTIRRKQLADTHSLQWAVED